MGTVGRKKTAREIIVLGLKRGETNEAILRRVAKAHPKSPLATLATINLTRNQVRKTDKTIPNNRRAKAAR